MTVKVVEHLAFEATRRVNWLVSKLQVLYIIMANKEELRGAGEVGGGRTLDNQEPKGTCG